MNTFYLQHRAVARVWAVLTMFAVLLSAFSAPFSVAFAEDGTETPVEPAVEVTVPVVDTDEEEPKKNDESKKEESALPPVDNQLPAAFTFVAQVNQESPLVDFCHWNEGNSQDGPFSADAAAKQALLNGHDDHVNDIIPVIDPELPNGVNLTTVYEEFGDLTGAEILALDCPKPPKLEEIKMCKYDALGAPIEDWEMTLTNDDVSYTLETGVDGCVSQTVDTNIGPWTVGEEMQKDWEQIDVSAVNGYVNSEDDETEHCVFYGRGEVDAITNYVQIPDTDKRCVFTNEYVPPCEDMPNGDWANTVVDFNQLKKNDGSDITDPNRTDEEKVLGAADWVNNGSTGFFSLGFGGSVTVEFDNYVPNVLGNDIAVHEATNNAYPAETAEVEVSQNGTDWETVGIASNTNVGKISYFDFDSTGFAWIKFVRVTDTSDDSLHADDADGFDVDAIAATQSVCDEPEEPKVCTVTIVSDTTDTVDGAAAKLVTFIHNAWDAVVDAPSKWIWGDDPVVDPVNETNQTFLKKFGWNGPVTNATLTIAVDNSYQVSVNGDVAGVDATEFNYVAANTHDLTTFIDQGNNELEVAVKNWALANGTTKTNPAGLKYELVITGTDAECDIDYEEPVEPKFSTVTMCKVDGNQTALSGWNLMLLGDEVDTVGVSATNGTGATVNLNTGAYVAVASGTWDNNRGPLNVVDAEYSTEDNWATQMDGFTGYGTDILELQLNGAVDPNSNWGAYNSGHEYARAFAQVATGTATFAIYDTFYGDNTGSLEVAVYEGYASTTNQNGCVVFENVPYGTYDVDEIMQDGWQNVSGLGEVTVDSETENFVVVNRPIGEPAPICNPQVNLLANGDFEFPEVTNGAQWDIFDSVLGWAIAWMNPTGAPTAASLELHEGVNGWLPAGGDQHTELDSDWQGPAGTSGEAASVAISQTVPTIAGKDYSLSWAFSPRPNTAANENVLQVLVNNTQVATNTAAGGTNTAWTPDNYVFTGTGSPVTVTFRDAGISNSEGTLLDNVSLNCREPENGGGNNNDDTFRLEGYVWHDDNGNTIWEQEIHESPVAPESPQEGWTVRATNGTTTMSTTTDAFGYYYFVVPAGTWTITEDVQLGWQQTTSPTAHVVIVPVLVTQSVIEKVLAYLVPTAHAALIDTISDLNFGNNESDVVVTPNDTSSSRSGGGGGTRVKKPTPTVAGDSISVPGLMPLVLGEQVTAVPYGAPGTGHGGSATTSGLTLLQVLFVQRRKDVA